MDIWFDDSGSLTAVDLSFAGILRASQYDSEAFRRQATTEIIMSLKPRVMAERQRVNLSGAYRSVAVDTDSPAKRLVGLQTSLAYLESALANQIQIAFEDKRLTAACEAFRKVLTNR